MVLNDNNIFLRFIFKYIWTMGMIIARKVVGELDCNLRINNCLERKFLFLKGKADEKEDNRKKTDSEGKKKWKSNET